MYKLKIPAHVAAVRAWLANEAGGPPYSDIEALCDYAQGLSDNMARDTQDRLARLERDSHPPLEIAQMLKGWISPEKHYARVNELITANNALVAEKRALKEKTQGRVK